PPYYHQLLYLVECLLRVPDEAGHPFLVDVLLPITGVGGQDDRPGLWQLDEQRVVARRVAVGAQRGHAGRELAVAVQEPPAVARELEVLAVVEALEERGRVVSVGVLVPLDNELGLREELRAARVVVVQVRDN